MDKNLNPNKKEIITYDEEAKITTLIVTFNDDECITCATETYTSQKIPKRV
jgi:hypothetical protein